VVCFREQESDHDHSRMRDTSSNDSFIRFKDILQTKSAHWGINGSIDLDGKK